MGVQQFLKQALKASLPTFDAEDVVFGEVTVQAVINEGSDAGQLGEGADIPNRLLTITFPADALAKPPIPGAVATARGRQWQVASEPPVHAGQIAITLTLEEPAKRKR